MGDGAGGHGGQLQHFAAPLWLQHCVVLPAGQEEVEATCFSLAERLEHMRSNGSELLILPICSQLPSDLQVGVGSQGVC